MTGGYTRYRPPPRASRRQEAARRQTRPALPRPRLADRLDLRYLRGRGSHRAVCRRVEKDLGTQMPIQFSVLASGSRGNTTLVRAGHAGVLIDFGLVPSALEGRLGEVGSGWSHVSAASGDAHARRPRQPGDLRWFANQKVMLYCHEGHRANLATRPGFRELDDLGLVRHFDDRPFLAPSGLRVEAVELSHDGGPTFGFRIEGRPERKARPVSVGYLADTGTWTEAMAEAMSDVAAPGRRVQPRRRVAAAVGAGGLPDRAEPRAARAPVERPGGGVGGVGAPAVDPRGAPARGLAPPERAVQPAEPGDRPGQRGDPGRGAQGGRPRRPAARRLPEPAGPGRTQASGGDPGRAKRQRAGVLPLGSGLIGHRREAGWSWRTTS